LHVRKNTAIEGRPYIVMAGLVPAIHAFLSGANKDADARA
jgi:hypothetical protein